jgi:hypothetical protein
VRFSEAFRETLFRFNIKAVDISQRSGVSERQISKFRNGGHLRIDVVERLLFAMTMEERKFLLDLVVGGESSNDINN